METKLVYFKRKSGKFYSHGEIEHEFTYFYDLVNLVRKLHESRSLPGLCMGHSDFIVYFEFNDVPHLIL